jgi:hypothetical protein
MDSTIVRSRAPMSPRPQTLRGRRIDDPAFRPRNSDVGGFERVYPMLQRFSMLAMKREQRGTNKGGHSALFRRDNGGHNTLFTRKSAMSPFPQHRGQDLFAADRGIRLPLDDLGTKPLIDHPLASGPAVVVAVDRARQLDEAPTEVPVYPDPELGVPRSRENKELTRGARGSPFAQSP